MTAVFARDGLVPGYHHWTSFLGWEEGRPFMRELIDTEGASNIMEIGAGRTPCLSAGEILERRVRYVANDAAADELALLDERYETLCLDMSSPLPADAPFGQFDLVFSRMVLEHVADAAQYYSNVYDVLAPGGLTVHFYATLGSLPALINRFAPQRVSDRIYRYASRGRHRYERFPARYNWCVGPTAAVRRRLEKIGFRIEDFRAYFGHGYYTRIPLLHRLEQLKAHWLVRHPVPGLASYGMVMLRKPLL